MLINEGTKSIKYEVVHSLQSYNLSESNKTACSMLYSLFFSTQLCYERTVIAPWAHSSFSFLKR